MFLASIEAVITQQGIEQRQHLFRRLQYSIDIFLSVYFLLFVSQHFCISLDYCKWCTKIMADGKHHFLPVIKQFALLLIDTFLLLNQACHLFPIYNYSGYTAMNNEIRGNERQEYKYCQSAHYRCRASAGLLYLFLPLLQIRLYPLIHSFDEGLQLFIQTDITVGKAVCRFRQPTSMFTLFPYYLPIQGV